MANKTSMVEMAMPLKQLLHRITKMGSPAAKTMA